jgi:hydroxyacylglutathione hydrolase
MSDVMRVVPVPCLKDNYAYLVVCERTGEAAVVDPSEAAPVLAAVERERVKLVAIWCTHHHLDHVGGNEEIASRGGIREVTGHASDRGRIPAQTRFLETGDVVTVGDVTARVIHIPGHTTGAVAYVIDAEGGRAVFTGDTLFLAGCGRMFEGTPSQFQASLTALAALPPDTRVYCGHEYTAGNVKFARHVEPSNAAIAQRAEALRVPSVPGTIGVERETNPFLRVREPEIRRVLGISGEADAADAFAAIRAAKDEFTA